MPLLENIVLIRERFDLQACDLTLELLLLYFLKDNAFPSVAFSDHDILECILLSLKFELFGSPLVEGVEIGGSVSLSHSLEFEFN